MSYATDLELEAYATARGYTLVATPAVLLTKAHDWIESFVYDGTKTDPLQVDMFPRTGIVAFDTVVDPLTVPTPIKTAEMRMAIEIDKGNDPFAAVARAVKRERVEGAVEVEYQSDAADTAKIKGIDHLIRPYLLNKPIFGYDR